MRNLLWALWASTTVWASTGPGFHGHLQAKQAVLMDYGSSQILYSKDADLPMAPSSMTKIMTAYVAFQALAQHEMRLDTEYLVSVKAWQKGGSRMFLDVGTRVKVDDLLKGILVSSGNDACVALSEGLSGSEEAFALRMMEQVKAMGLKNTYFVNGTGWPDEGHISSAYDLAKISQALVRDFPELYKTYFSLREFYFNKIKQPNRNNLLYRDPTVDGLKTGHTEQGGYGLAASAERGGMRLMTVVNGLDKEADRLSETAQLLEWGFSAFIGKQVLAQAGPLAVIPIEGGQTIPLSLDQPLHVLVRRGHLDDMRMSWESAPVQAPVTLGQVLAHLVLTPGDGLTPQRIPLVADIAVPKAGWLTGLFAKARYMVYPPPPLDGAVLAAGILEQIRQELQVGGSSS